MQMNAIQMPFTVFGIHFFPSGTEGAAFLGTFSFFDATEDSIQALVSLKGIPQDKNIHNSCRLQPRADEKHFGDNEDTIITVNSLREQETGDLPADYLLWYSEGVVPVHRLKALMKALVSLYPSMNAISFTGWASDRR